VNLCPVSASRPEGAQYLTFVMTLVDTTVGRVRLTLVSIPG
jgi:hypothetical protein